MSHKELVEKIERFTFLETTILQKALQEVIALHQPRVENPDNDYLICDECSEISWRSEKWPCMTIKVIKEFI